MSVITPEISAAIVVYVEMSAFVFQSAYDGGIKIGMTEKMALEFAKQLLSGFMTPVQPKQDNDHLANLMMRMSSGKGS